jgi:hypothetical protein
VDLPLFSETLEINGNVLQQLQHEKAASIGSQST